LGVLDGEDEDDDDADDAADDDADDTADDTVLSDGGVAAASFPVDDGRRIASALDRTASGACIVATSASTNDAIDDRNAMTSKARTPPNDTNASTEQPPNALATLTTPENDTKYPLALLSNTLAMNDQCCVDSNDT